MRTRRLLLLAFTGLVLGAAPVPAATAATVLAAGDIAVCGSSGDDATAALLDARPDATVAALGDNVYEDGTAAEFAQCYDPSWGRAKGRTRPAAGNHEYHTPGAAGYFDYFGAAAGSRDTGYYSYDLDGWHVVVLNTNCAVVSCASGSEQERWLRADLAASTASCTLAYGHHPRFSSGSGHGDTPAVAPLWRALYDGGAELVLAGHDHNYERFGPQTPDGASDDAYGLRSFVVGTGGTALRQLGTMRPNSEARSASAHGVLELTLRDGGYDWRFVPVAGQSYADSGSGACHVAPPAPLQGNLIPNPGFEGGLDGWRSWRGTLTSVAGKTGAGARVTPAADAKAASAYPSPKPVSSTASETYSASAWVRGSRTGMGLCLTIRAWSGGSVSGSREACAVADGTWQRLDVAYAPGAGRQLEAFVLGQSTTTGFTFDVDDVHLGTAAADTTPPQTAIDSGPAASTSETTARFTFSATESGSFSCSLDGGGWSACSSPHDVTVSAGDHVLRVRVTDAAGNTDPTPAEWSWTVASAPPPPPPPASTNLVPNPGFEDGLGGWGGWRSSLSLVAGRTGGSAARVARVSGSSHSVYRSPKPVAAAEAGGYQGSAWVRSETPGRTLCVVVREWANGAVVGSGEACAAATSGWTRLPTATYTARGGGPLEVYVIASGVTDGESFDVDDVELARG